MVTRSVFLAFILGLAMSSCFQTPEKSKYYVPDGYVGTVVIMFQQQNGMDPDFDRKGTNLFSIPKDGILFSTADPTFGIIDEEYWYAGEMGNQRRKLRIIYSHTQVDTYSDEVVVYNPQTIAVMENYDTIGNLVSTTPPGLSFLVAPQNQIVELSNKRDQKILYAYAQLNLQ